MSFDTTDPVRTVFLSSEAVDRFTKSGTFLLEGPGSTTLALVNVSELTDTYVDEPRQSINEETELGVSITGEFTVIKSLDANGLG